MSDQDIVRTVGAGVVSVEIALIEQAISAAAHAGGRGVRVVRSLDGRLVSVSVTTEVEAWHVEEHPYGMADR